MEANSLNNKLKAFQDDHNAVTKGLLALLVQLTRIVRSKPFPLNPDDFLTENKGQVAGLSGGNLRKILGEHGITQTLAAEGGRTSRGNMGLMIKYVEFLMIEKCRGNIRFGFSPIIITIFERVRTALDLAADAELSGRVEVWDIQQFLSTNIHEHGMFDTATKNVELSNIIEKYNEIIAKVETDPSLRIEFEGK